MTIEQQTAVVHEVKSLTEEISEQAMAAVQAASRAMEAEATAMRELEDALKKANETVAEVRRAIRAEATAKTVLAQARNKVKLALIEANRVTKVEGRADKEAKRKGEKLKHELEKAAEAEKRGKLPNVGARDEAKRESEEAEQRAKAARGEADKAREALTAANTAFKAAQYVTAEASTRIRAGRAAVAAAKGKIAHTEDDAKKVIIEAKKALEIQAGAKKGVDRTIRGLRAVMDHEARRARAVEATAAVSKREYQETESSVQKTVGRVTQTLKTLVHPEGKIVKVIQAATAKTRRGPKSADQIREAVKSDIGGVKEKSVESAVDSELSSGLVKLVVLGPTDLVRVGRIQEQLERPGDCRVKSVGGSSGEGTNITVLVDQPVALLPRLRELEFVEWVARKGTEIEVTLKPFSKSSAKQADSRTPVMAGEKKPGDPLSMLS